LVCLGGALPEAHSLAVIPPLCNDIGNPHSVFIVQADSTSLVCPEGYSVINIVTQLDISDDEASWEQFTCGDGKKLAISIVGSVIALLQDQSISFSTFHKLCHKIFLRPLFEFDPLGSVLPVASELPNGAAITGECSGFQISLDESVLQAKAIFQRLFPEKEFSTSENIPNDEDEMETIVEMNEMSKLNENISKDVSS
jgi:hypothetical protein